MRRGRVNRPCQRPARGRYIATVACGEFHGLNQDGNSEQGVPDLAVVKAYSREEFARLMKTGVAKGGRDIGFMSETARSRLTAFNDEELAALKTYLDARSITGSEPAKAVKAL